MHISLTPTLEKSIREKVESGLYNNASEVVREALRFMETHEELIRQMKLDALRRELRLGAEQAERGEFVAESMEEIIAEARQRRNG
jgi:antitoxin ParD1/3/4